MVILSQHIDDQNIEVQNILSKILEPSSIFVLNFG